MSIFLFVLGALAEEPLCTPENTSRAAPRGTYELLIPVVSRDSSGEPHAPPAMACRAGVSGAAEIHDRAEQVRLTVQQLPDNSELTCNGYVVTRIGSMVATMRPDGAELIRTYQGGIDSVGSDVCMSVTQAQDELVKRLDACSGVTPPPLATRVVERHAP